MLERSLVTDKALIYVKIGELILKFNKEEGMFNVSEVMKIYTKKISIVIELM